MKKVISLFLVVIVLGIPISASAAEQVKSEARITFYQPSNKNQTIPMEKVLMKNSQNAGSQLRDSDTSSGSKMFPKTNEEKSFLLVEIGLLILGLVSFIAITKNKLNDKGISNEKA
ncbi:LPXTG cell wall anchor domain-containing protein [Enterococcus phoeniculicola]|jgi:LPXTG-motif cell wall-anchored protein|uniref:LPXTG-domain-containing protein cell wall anchor domain n=1 Tax=Enterococcus phoeniculicola ATCC BAA-412 TaxID=1158610 RepID=R3WLQ5_9ENTE|nr:LPXTG cell wall anchor domain-containing protein [Enterococcus phoeniculicola]EOL48781.1 LPXTG-domain-containing protein cell wall anchor domain [Enterococcus phoeniculicola ATCC BAA-412]EOT72627.1 hypothetical protein I589_02896 [Enterococcus phoeniculicola ATCC BAA-412]